MEFWVVNKKLSKRPNNKCFTGFCVCLVVILLLTACGPKNGTSSAVSAESGWSSGAVSKSPVQSRYPVNLPRYEYDGSDPIAKLVYQTELDYHKEDADHPGTFVIVAPTIIEKSKEDALLKVFVITDSSCYNLWSNQTITQGSSGGFPVAITYQKQKDGSYRLKSYERPEEGDDVYVKSVHAFCTTPATHREIVGLADTMMSLYASNSSTNVLNENLAKYLKKNHLTNFKMV